MHVCEHEICLASAFTRRANGVTQDGAKVAGGAFLKEQKEGGHQEAVPSHRSHMSVLQPCLRRSARSAPTGLRLHTGTGYTYWSSATTEGEGGVLLYCIRPEKLTS